MTDDEPNEMAKVTPLQADLLNRAYLTSLMQTATTDTPELFHYTSADGFAGILHDCSIWMTNAAYLNDEQELTYPVRLARAIVQSFSDHDPDARRREFLGAINRSLDSHILYKSWFITSFTLEGNSVSQWRAYCQNGGYSVGMNGQRLVNSLPDRSSYLYGPIVYDPGEQAKRVAAVLRRYFDVWSEFRVKHAAVPDDEFDRDVAESLSFWLGRELVFFKIEPFESEHEWRLARMPLHNSDVLFRSRAGVLTPYLNVPLVPPNTGLPLTRVYVSPLGDNELATHAAKLLLIKEGYSDVELYSLRYRLRF